MSLRSFAALIPALLALGTAPAIGQVATAAPASGPKNVEVDLSGRILLPNGKPATSKTSLYVAWMDSRFQSQYRKVEVSPDGKFAFKRSLKQVMQQTGGMALMAFAPGEGSKLQSIGWTKARNRSFDIKMETGGSIVGRVVDPSGKPVSGAKMTLKSVTPTDATRFTGDPETQSVFMFLRSIPPKLLQGGQSAVTDASGRFEMKGLLRQTTAQIASPEGYMLAAGSHAPVHIRSDVNQAGLLVVVKPGSLKITLTDPVTKKPVPNTGVIASPAGPLQLFAVQAAAEDSAAMMGMGGNATDEKGQITMAKLAPGEYLVEVSGLERKVTIKPSEQTSLEMIVRGGMLTGKVLDAEGKPCSASIMMEAPIGASRSPFAQFAFGGPTPAPIGQSQADGKFQIPTFPWGAKQVTLRATRGNDEAEWKGDPSKIKGDVVLTMRRGALATVTGRLVDPHYKPIKACKASTIQWRDDQPRISWLMNAKQTDVDKEGRFTIQGLRRGESFSVLSGSPFMGGESEENGFESPRFAVATSLDTKPQDLGDVVIHPLNGGDQILQIYGFESRDQLARLTALMTETSDEKVESARKALLAYSAAIELGDIAAAQKATSRISPGWSSDLNAFAQGVMLRAAKSEEIASARPLRFLPKFSLAYVLTFGKAQNFTNLNFGAASHELDQNPDWVLFMSNDSDPRSLGLVRREDGVWRVVNIGVFPGGLDEFVLLGPGRQAGRPADAKTPAPKLAEADRTAVESTAREYLAAWKREDAGRLQQLTSPFSTTWGKDPAGMLKAFERRADEGRCPAHKSEDLAVLDGLTTWETAWLASYAGSIQEISGVRNTRPRVPAGMQEGYPNAFAAKGDIAVVRYEGSDGPYLMVLVRLAGDWRVLEGAVPLG
jgi:hypothetical protein